MTRYKLSEICKIVSGSTPKTNVPEYWDGENVWITPAEITDKTFIVYDSQRKLSNLGVEKTHLSSFPKGTVILSSRAPIGKVAIAGVEMFCNQGFKNLICSEKIMNEYLYWFLKGKTKYLNSLGRGATFKELSAKIIGNIELEVPSIQEQKEVVIRLRKIDQIIGVFEREVELLDELIKARFVEMFGDPVINSYQLPVQSMTDICDIIDGDRGKNYPKAEDILDSGYCLFLNAKNVTQKGFDFESCNFITREKDDALRKGKLSRGDVVLTTRGTVGNLAYYSEDIPYENIRINSGMVILRMNRNILNEIYFIELFKMKLSDIKEKNASGSAQPQLPISTMNKIILLIPPLELQNQFASFVQEIDKSRSRIQKSLEASQELFDSLMQEYFG